MAEILQKLTDFIPSPMAGKAPVKPSDIGLLPHQVAGKNFMNEHPFCGVFFDMGLGKALDDEAYLPTPTGFRQVKTILPGDILFDHEGRETFVTSVFHHTNITAYLVTLSDGRRFVCSYDHLIPLTKHKFGRDIDPTPLHELVGRELRHNGKQYLYGIPMPRACPYPAKQHQLPPELLGFILRHGAYQNKNLVLTLDDQDTLTGYCSKAMQALAQWSESEWQEAGENAFVLKEPKKLLDVMLSLDYIPEAPLSVIPGEYAIDSRANRAMFLAGYFHIDKTVIDACPKGPQTKKALTVTVDCPYQTLAYHLRMLINSMGFICETKYVKSKKATRLRTVLASDNTDRLYIAAIEQQTKRNMTCFTVDSPDHTYMANDYIPTHNTLISLVHLLETNPHGHVLVIAPKNIARNTWLDEIKKWNIPLRTKSFVCDENYKDLTRKKRLQRYAEIVTDKPTVYFINRELLLDLIKNMPVINGQPTWFFPYLVIDESQSFKSYTAERFKALKPIRPILKSVILLSGTPRPKDLMDLWPQIYLLDMGHRLGTTITQYRETFFRPTGYVNGHPINWKPLPGAEDEIYRRISDITISAKNTQLPELTFNNFKVYMEQDEWELYNQFAKEAVVDIDLDTQVTATNRGVLANKLSQLASGTIYTDAEHNYKVIHQRKIEAVNQIIAGSSGSVMVAYYYNSDREILQREIPGAVLFDGSHDMQERWNRGEIPVLLLHPASAGHGLNLQFGGHVLIWYTVINNLEYYLQTNARLRRPGQQYPVIIHHIIADGTIDEPNLVRLQKRESDEDSMLEVIRLAVNKLN